MRERVLKMQMGKKVFGGKSQKSIKSNRKIKWIDIKNIFQNLYMRNVGLPELWGDNLMVTHFTEV